MKTLSALIAMKFFLAATSGFSRPGDQCRLNTKDGFASSKLEAASGLAQSLKASGFSFELDPEKWNQFEALNFDFSNTQLVGLGEATHGTSEFSTVRHQLFRYLVERHGYRVFVLEDEWIGGIYVTEALEDGTDLESALNKLTKRGTFLTRETLELFKWIEAFNQNHPGDSITIYGADMQSGPTVVASLEYLAEKLPAHGVEATQLKSKIEDLLARFSEPDFADTLTLESIKDALVAARQFETAAVSTLGRSTDKRIRRLEGLVRMPAQFIQKLSADVFEFISQTKGPEFMASALSDQSFVSLLDKQCLDGGFVCRDHFMASNIKLALDVEKKRGVYWAHNGHVGRFLNHPNIIWANPRNEVVETIHNTGSFLNDIYGPHYFTIITDFYKGSFLARDSNNATNLKSWSVESAVNDPLALHSLIHGFGKPNFAINFRSKLDEKVTTFLDRPQLFRVVGATFSDESNTLADSYMTAILPKFADAYLYFDTSTPHVPL
ncbi:MAG: erythromycin esterase family protein [Pseudobdellovibrionaceae bacterium]|nr:erythromycin esterase family protein [Pseudobdellovibrionaceae bacterium]